MPGPTPDDPRPAWLRNAGRPASAPPSASPGAPSPSDAPIEPPSPAGGPFPRPGAPFTPPGPAGPAEPSQPAGVRTLGALPPHGGPPPSIAPPRREERSPVERLDPGARSVVVPAVVSLVLMVLAPVAALVAGIAAWSEAVDASPNEVTNRWHDCQAGMDAITDEIDAHRSATGAEPLDDADLSPYDHGRYTVRYGPYTEAFVAPTPDGPCDIDMSIVTWAYGGPVEHEGDDILGTDAQAIARAFTPDEPVALIGFGLVGTAVGILAWWLAQAYRSLPTSDRTTRPSRAYAPLWALGASFVVSSLVQGFALAAGGNVSDSALVLYFWLFTVGASWFAFFWALREVADMVGDITDAFGQGYLPSRIMRGALKIAMWALVTAAVAGALAPRAPPSAILAFLAFLVVLPIAGCIALVAYAISVVTATRCVEEALEAAATQLDAREPLVTTG